MDQADSSAVHSVISNGGHQHLQRRPLDTEPCIRVGALYQAVLPPFAPPVSPPPRPLARPVDDNDVDAADARFATTDEQADDDVGGQTMWLASRIKQSRTRQTAFNQLHIHVTVNCVVAHSA